MQQDKQLAIIFPGQGSQTVGMLKPWLEHEVAQATLKQAKTVLGDALIHLIEHGPKEQLDLTINTQPAMLLVDVMAYRVWQAITGIEPAYMAGHSLGEYAALVCAEAISLTDALGLVQARAQTMQQAVPSGQGAMAAILGLEASQVVQICQQISRNEQIVQAVNFNDLKQTVIAGHAQAVNLVCEQLKQAGARRVLSLPVSGPFHSSLMQPAAVQLQKYLQPIHWQAPKIPVINNVDVALTSLDNLQDALYRQVFNPVRWTETIQKMHNCGVTKYIELGSGKALTGMVKRIVPTAVAANMVDLISVQQAKQLMLAEQA